jgi:SAM-dependent methyltransferase
MPSEPSAPFPRPSLIEGTIAHYASAEHYDRIYRRQRADIGFYLEEVRQQGRRRILELGCGSGRITLALARAGLQVVGVDLSPPMLRAARAKLATQSKTVQQRVELHQADIRTLHFEEQFDAIIGPFNVLQHLYSQNDLERCLSAVRHHLQPKAGRFIFDVLLPDVQALARNPEKRYKLGQMYHPFRHKKVAYQESFDYDPLSQVLYVTMYFIDEEEPQHSLIMPLCHRQFFPAEMKALLHYNGFEVLKVFGGFAHEPLGADSESQIYLCRLTS